MGAAVRTGLVPRRADLPEAVRHIIEDDGASDWLRGACWRLMLRDPVEALKDAHELAGAMEAWEAAVRALKISSESQSQPY